jgi:hypothetical protein
MQTTTKPNAYFRGSDLIVFEDGRSAVVNVKDGAPAVEVKDYFAYHNAPDFRAAYETIGEARAGALYECAQEDFWRDAERLAEERGFNSIGQAGHSGGWLWVEGTRFLDYIVVLPELTIPPADETADDETRTEYASMIAERDRFFAFALDITEMVTRAQNGYREAVIKAARTGELVDACWRD